MKREPARAPGEVAPLVRPPGAGPREEAPAPGSRDTLARHAAGGVLAPREVLHLQRLVGNRAVGRLLNGTRGSAPPAVQREIPYKQYKGTYKDEVSDYVSELHKAVQNAWAAIQATPLLGSLAGLDGHTELWVEKMAYLAKHGEDPGGLHTAFGYAVESLVTGPLLPAKPNGLSVDLQGSRGGTRPDVILREGTTDVAWLDITASASSGHIFGKEGGWQQIDSYAEITYPSIGTGELLAMKKAVPKTLKTDIDLGIDPREALEKARQAREELERKRLVWNKLGTEWLAEVKKIPVTGLSAHNGYELRQERTAAILGEKLGLGGMPPRVAASLVLAMKLNPATYGFHTGVLPSAATGLSILQDIDPAAG